MKIAVVTLGCKTNQAESFQIERILNSSGHEIVDISSRPDLCIINTCTVTSKADYQSRNLLSKAVRHNAKVIITGCYSELNAEEIQKKFNDVTVVRNCDKHKIVTMIHSENPISDNHIHKYPRYRPIVKVQDGCNNSCSYCAITQARGRSRSIPVEEVIREISSNESLGYKEIVLTGIHLGAYGRDLMPRKSLAYLLREILSRTKIHRIRLSSLEIREIDDEINEIACDDRICKHLHVPLQSGSDIILDLMNRSYTSTDFLSGVEKILKKHTGISLGTDVIVGFPGEGEDEFNSTRSLIENLPFSYLHVFPFSSRSGTRASSYPSQVNSKTKKERVSVLRATGRLKKDKFLRRNIGYNHEVIIEGRIDEEFIGTTSNYIKVLIDSHDAMDNGTLVPVRITGIRDDMAIGYPINTSELLNI